MSTEWDNIQQLDSTEGNVSKFVFTKDSAVAEAVLYRYPTYADRTVICCSTQSGCPVGCRFCGAGDNFVRNLTAAEITSQPLHLLEQIAATEGTLVQDMAKLQIMFMSMGEPMLNQKSLLPALSELNQLHPKAALLVSSSGPRVNYDRFIELSQEISSIGLQFSIHESTDEARDKLIPFKAKLTLAEIAEMGERWAMATGRRPFFNYCVHESNSSLADVGRLLKLFDPEVWEATLSVICERDETLSIAHRRQQELTGAFMRKVLGAGYSARMFDPAGQDDIGGGCGQLHYVQQWFKEHPDKARPSIGFALPVVHAPIEVKR